MTSSHVAHMTIQAAEKSFTIKEMINQHKKGKLMLRLSPTSKQIKPIFTFYYPYVFSEWKVTVPRYLFPEGRALIRIGVNGLTSTAAQTEVWPAMEQVQIEEKNCLPFQITDKTHDAECKRALENYVYKAMRPLKPPVYVLNRKEKVYLPYHVFLESSSKKVMITEALTGVTAEAKKMKELKEWLRIRTAGTIT